jgi:hypothetical protein
MKYRLTWTGLGHNGLHHFETRERREFSADSDGAAKETAKNILANRPLFQARYCSESLHRVDVEEITTELEIFPSWAESVQKRKFSADVL